jgi:hypothetical protein
MELAAIPEIRVETAGNEATYWLPARPLGALRWLGWIPVGFSLFWIAEVCHMFRDLFPELLRLSRTHSGFDHIFAYGFFAFVLAFIVAGCVPAAFGLLAMFGRCRIKWRDGRLRVSETLGPLGWRRHMPRAAIRKFTVEWAVSDNKRPVAASPLASLAALVAEFEKGKPRFVAVAYPQEWLRAIATDLSSRAGGSQPAAPRIEVTDDLADPPEFRDVAEKPADSPVVIQRQSSGIVLEIPPAGLRKGSMGLFAFACAWCLFMAVFTFLVVFGKQAKPSPGNLPFWPFLAGFWAIGLGMMAGAVHLGKRRATLTAGKSGLIVVVTSPFGVKRREFRREEIAAVRADDSNVKVNNSPLLELQVHPVTGKKVGLFVNRDPGELRWMATELRNALGVPAES